jgi:hypothetical protein
MCAARLPAFLHEIPRSYLLPLARHARHDLPLGDMLATPFGVSSCATMAMALMLPLHGTFENDQLDVFPTTTHNTARSRCVADIGLALLVHFTNCAGPASIAHGGHLPAKGTIADVCVSSTYSFLARSRASVPSILYEKRAPPRDAMVRDA